MLPFGDVPPEGLQLLGTTDNEKSELSLGLFKVLASECDCEICRILRPAMLKMIRSMSVPKSVPGSGSSTTKPSARQVKRRVKRNA